MPAVQTEPVMAVAVTTRSSEDSPQRESEMPMLRTKRLNAWFGRNRVEVAAVDARFSKQHIAFHDCSGNRLVHPVETAKHRRLAAA